MGNIIGRDLNVDQDYLAEAVRQTVIMGISESLNGKNEITSQLVASVLSTKVDDRGCISNYERHNTQTLLEYHVRNAITETVKAEIAKVVEECRPQIAECIRKELSKKSTQGDLVSAFINSIKGSLKWSYNTNVDIYFKPAD